MFWQRFLKTSHQLGISKAFVNGTLYQNHPLFSVSPSSLIINIYDDEFTITNPLGNKTKGYKILAFYFTIANFHPRFNANLNSIQLLVIAKSTDLKKYGVDLLLAPLIEDLKHLESVGLSFKFQNQDLCFTDSAALVISDNLDAHWLSGFQENFRTVKRVCRFCMCLRVDMCKCFDVNELAMRTVETCNEYVKGIKVNHELISEYGIKSECCLNELNYFHSAEGFPADVAHDFFEGIIPYFLTNLIVKFVQAGYISLAAVNEQITNFSYAKSDKKDTPKPFTISSLTTFNIKLTAAECCNFVRLFPFMFGLFVPTTDFYWVFLGDLLDCVELFTAIKYDEALIHTIWKRGVGNF